MQQKNQSFDVKNVTYRYVGLTANVDFDNFIDAATLFDEINSSRIKLTHAKKKDNNNNQMEFKSKLHDI